APKLLAVFIQHSDSKPEQQRLICRDQPKTKNDGKNKNENKKKSGSMPCEHPFMYVHDVGLTFGRANRWNQDPIGSMNLAEWSKTPVWKDASACTGNL